MIEVKIRKESDDIIFDLPSDGNSGIDIRAKEGCVLKSLKTKLIKTGVFLQIPEGYEAQVRSRSGLALNHGLFVLNSPGTIDSSYRGEIGVILANFSDEEYGVQKNERIAQIVFMKIETPKYLFVEQLDESNRNDNGYGSTGKI